MDKKFKVIVDKSFEYNLQSSDLDKLDILKLTESRFHSIQNNKSSYLKILESNFNKKEYIIKINSNNYTVKISDQLDVLIEKMGFSLGSTKKTNEVKAPMPGLILDLLVEENQVVKEGETLLILEAMKMENTITAQRDGIIKSIIVTKGNTVEKGELMIIMA